MEKNNLTSIAAHLLSGILSNPHIYASVSDEGAQGQQEQKLIQLAIEMAESLIIQTENRNSELA